MLRFLCLCFAQQQINIMVLASIYTCTYLDSMMVHITSSNHTLIFTAILAVRHIINSIMYYVLGIMYTLILCSHCAVLGCIIELDCTVY